MSSTRESLFVSNTLHICTLVTSHSLEQQRYRHFHLHPYSDSYTLIFDFAPLRSLCLFSNPSTSFDSCVDHGLDGREDITNTRNL